MTFFVENLGNVAGTSINELIMSYSEGALPITRYLNFRARAEHQAMQLTDNWFQLMLNAGARFFFGIETDQEGEVLRDNRSPEIFLNWRNSE